jgi:hypothetical protein
MNKDDALKSLEVIREVILQTRREVSQSGPYLVWWGSLVLVTSMVQQWFSLIPVTNWLVYAALWGVFNAIGWSGTAVMSYRYHQRQTERFTSSFGKNIALIWIGIVVAISMVVLLSFLKVFSPMYIWSLQTLLVAVGLFTTGIIISDEACIALSILTLPVVTLMVLFPVWQYAMYALIFGGGLLWLGLRCLKEGGRVGTNMA